MGGSLLYEEFSDIFEKYKYLKMINNFVETGTYKGQTTLMAAQHFERVYTIEIAPNLYNESVAKFKEENANNITAYLGDSVDILPRILDNIEKGAFYFIDAHQSGSDTSFNKKQRVPLFQELDMILKAKISPSVYIFDDVRFWKGQPKAAWDWGHISVEDILQRFNAKDIPIIEHYIKNDRFYVLTM